MRLMLHTIQVGDTLTMIGPDGRQSEPFTLADMPRLTPEFVWLYRCNDAPIVVDRCYGLGSAFELHARPTQESRGYRTLP
jgi:hypothetical protein